MTGIRISGPVVPDGKYAVAPAAALPAGTYFYPVSPTASTISSGLGNNNIRVAPAYISNTVSIDRMGCEVTTAGESGSVVRLGVYASANSMPGALVVDAGTVDAATIGVKEAAFTAVTLAAGWYWLAIVVQGAPTTQPALRGISIPTQGMPLSLGTGTPTANSTSIGYSQGSVAGALPATFTGVGVSGFCARPFFRVAV